MSGQGRIEFCGLKCRPLGPDDADMISMHRQTMFLEAGGNPDQLSVMTKHFQPWLEERLTDGRYYGFALSDGDQVAAAIGLMSIEWPPHPSHPTSDRRGYVLNVFFEPTYRRRGLASALMQIAKSEFAKGGIDFAVLHATEVGKPVYEQKGWVRTSEMAKQITR